MQGKRFFQRRPAGRFIILPGVALLLVLAACSPNPGAVIEPTVTVAPTVARPATDPAPTAGPTPIVSHGNDIGGYVDFVDQLRAAGAVVKPDSAVEQPFFPVGGQLIQVNGAEVQVYEFETAAAREAVSGLITPEGQPNPTTMVSWMDQPNFWATDRIVVLYVGADPATIELLNETLGDPLTAATGDGEGASGPSDGETALPPVQAAVQLLADHLQVAEGDIEVVRVEEAEWTDSCLGLGGPAESCLQVITPGYLIILRADGLEYEFHTNIDGSSVRQK